MLRTPLIVLLIACSPVKSSPATRWSDQYCESKVEMVFPDDAWAEYDGCKDLTMDAHYEFDPDDPPEVLDYKIQLNGIADPNVECWLVLTAGGVCGPGRYGIGSDHSATVQFATYDCPFVPDAYESTFTAQSGDVYLDTVRAGDRTGDFTDRPLMTQIAGRLDATTEEGVALTVEWDVGVFISSSDAEESDCSRIE